MNQIVEICFRYQQNFYCCVVGVKTDPIGNYFLIELLDEDLIKLFETQEIKYTGEKGYTNLPAYKNAVLRPLLIHITNLVTSVKHIRYKQS